MKTKNNGETYVEDFEAGDVEHTDESDAFLAGLEGDVTLLDEPLEGAIEDALGQGAHRVGHLVLVAALGHELVAYLDLGLGQVLVQVSAVYSHQLADLVTFLYGRNEDEGEAGKGIEKRSKRGKTSKLYFVDKYFCPLYLSYSLCLHSPRCRRARPAPLGLSA